MKRSLRLIAVLAILALIAAACGGDDSSDTTTATTAPPATTTTTADTGGGDTTTTTEPVDAGPATDIGVAPAPCDDAVNAGNGCIYLGVISDLTVGPFSALAIPAVGGLRAFWADVNANGGLGGFDVIVSEENTFDAQYDPQLTVQGYTDIESGVLMLAQSLGTSQTIAILDRLVDDNVVTVPATWWSGWSFDETDGNGLVLEAGANYCFEAMNDFDFAVSQFGQDMTYGIIGFPNDYGLDYGAGVRIAAAANGFGDPVVDLVQIPIAAGGDVTEAVTQVLANAPDVVFITTGPFEMAQTLGGMAQNGGTSVFIGTHPTWNPALPQAAPELVPALEALYFQSDWIPGWYGDSEGHQKAKAAADAEGQAANEWYLNGWASQYPIKAILEAAISNGDLTRAGVAGVVKTLDDVNYEGMIPNGDFATGPSAAPRASLINKVDAEAPGGTVNVAPLAVGPTAAAHDFTGPCFEIAG
jgi:ABC-type branched-subunit amino acid transport system substrate-binding protein